MNYKRKKILLNSITYIILSICMLVVLYPIFIMIITSFKSNMEVLTRPLGLPSKWSFSSYMKVLELSHFFTYYKNSFIITGISLLLTVVTAALASYPLARFQFRLNKAIYLFFIFGVMLPIRLAVIDLFNLLQYLGLYNNLWGLIFIYTAMGIPFSILIITGFMLSLPKGIEEAARMDGCGDMKLLGWILVPLIRPAIATTAIYNFIPIWNDFFFPLIFLKDESLKTVPLGTAIFFGQFQTQWPTVFAALTLAILPPLIFYLLLSGQFIKGLTAGAVKG